MIAERISFSVGVQRAVDQPGAGCLEFLETCAQSIDGAGTVGSHG